MTIKILDEQDKPIRTAPRGMFASLIAAGLEHKPRTFVVLPDSPSEEMLHQAAQLLNGCVSTARAIYHTFLLHAPELGPDDSYDES